MSHTLSWCLTAAAGKRRSAEKKRQADTQPDTQAVAPVDDEPPEPKWHWITTTPSGERIVTKQHEDTNIPVPPALVSKASDPSTHQVGRLHSTWPFCLSAFEAAILFVCFVYI